MYYPAQIEVDNVGFAVRFRDIPEAITCADTLDEAKQMAADALLTAMDFYFETKRPVPMPSDIQSGDTAIALPPSVVAKILLLNEMLAQRVTPSELARRMGTRPQEVNRIIDLHHTTKIDTIATALSQLGKRLSLGTVTA